MPPESPTPNAATSSPSASGEEPQDLETIQANYRRAFAEGQRLLADPKATKITKPITETTTGVYRESIAGSLASARKQRIRIVDPGKVIGVALKHWSAAQVSFYGCEDYSDAKWARSDGSEFTRQPTKFEQSLRASKSDGKWRIDDVDSKVVQSFGSSPCNGRWLS